MNKTRTAAWLLTGVLAGVLGMEKKSEPVIIPPESSVMYIEEQTAPELNVTGNTDSEKLTPVVWIELEPEEWHGTDRKLSEYEWDILGQMIMGEARGESFTAQYYIACVVLNRVDSPLFPDTVAGVIYQTEPAVQFCGAWDAQEYEVSDSVWEAIQAALIQNDLPEDVLYFTSEGWLPETEAWKSEGNLWFSRQGGLNE